MAFVTHQHLQVSLELLVRAWPGVTSLSTLPLPGRRPLGCCFLCLFPFKLRHWEQELLVVRRKRRRGGGVLLTCKAVQEFPVLSSSSLTTVPCGRSRAHQSRTRSAWPPQHLPDFSSNHQARPWTGDSQSPGNSLDICMLASPSRDRMQAQV